MYAFGEGNTVEKDNVEITLITSSRNQRSIKFHIINHAANKNDYSNCKTGNFRVHEREFLES